MNPSHVDIEKWNQMSIFEQMGNIGSEVGRALAAKRRGDTDSVRGALYRGMDLLDITAVYWAGKQPGRAREILRAKEQFGEAILTDKNDPDLENYFMQYAIAARLNR